MDLKMTFPGGVKVNAQIGDHTIKTDQPLYSGGDDSAPSPFVLFIASMGTCAGYYVLSYCQQHNLPVEGITLDLSTQKNTETGLINAIDISINVPESFPAKYHTALVRSAEQCTVKKHLDNPPKIDVHTVIG